VSPSIENCEGDMLPESTPTPHDRRPCRSPALGGRVPSGGDRPNKRLPFLTIYATSVDQSESDCGGI